MKNIAIASAALCAASALVPTGAAAQTPEQWKWTGMIYAYLPTIGGKTTFPQTAPASDVSVDASKIVDNLQGVFMGSLGAQKGQWGLFTDILYMDVGSSKSSVNNFQVGRAGIPAGASADANFDLKGTVWTLGGSYRVATDPSKTLDLVFGARMLDVKQSLGWQVNGNVGPIALPGRAGNLSTSLNNWDAIVGVKGQLALGDSGKWFAPYYADVGTGNSDLTWQATVGIGYKFGWGEVIGAWRYLDYKMKSGKPIEDLNFNGPAIGAVFHW